MRRVGIVGGTGYTGVELIRLLLQHPHVQLHVVSSRTEAGVPLADFFPNLRGHTALKFSDIDTGALKECEVVFFATPHGVAMKQAGALLANGTKVIDLSADFRLRDPAVWAHWYGMEHTAPELLVEAVYGLPELHRTALKNARLVANPGCYPTAILLGYLPLLAGKAILLNHLIADAKSGASGAGRKAETHLLLAETSDSLSAYGVSGHRHLPEIVQQMNDVTGQSVDLTFCPHLIPMIRGMQATLYGELCEDEDAQHLYEKFYADEPFVDVMPTGSIPTTRSVRAANVCRIAVHRPGLSRRVVVLSVIDNLMKGAAGQAIQNMNILMGIAETSGLMALPIQP